MVGPNYIHVMEAWGKTVKDRMQETHIFRSKTKTSLPKKNPYFQFFVYSVCI